MNQGYVYVLYNQSFPDLVKIGMTTRDPENRVSELSGATGVPTPFVLLYKKYYADCHLAEKLVHEHLAKKRLNDSREFFSMQPNEAITFIQNLEIPEQYEDYNHYNIVDNPHNDIIDSIVKEADAYYFGHDGYLEDYDKAYSLYKKASSFNNGYADFQLGGMHMLGEGCKKDKIVAMNYFKKSSSNNYRKSFGQLGYYYLIDNELRHVENSLKCWKLYFDDPDTIEGIESYDYFDLHTTAEYIALSIENNIDLIFLPLIEECLDFIDMQMHNNIVKYQNSGHEPDFKDYLISRMKKGIDFIDQYNKKINI